MNKVSLSIKEYLALYAAFARVTFLTQLEYRGQYFVRMLSKIVAWSSGFITILIMLNQFNVMGNWTKYEILFLYGWICFPIPLQVPSLWGPSENCQG